MAPVQQQVDLIGRLAEEFSRLICESLTTTDIAEAIRIIPSPQNPIIAATLATLERNAALVPRSEFLGEILLRHSNHEFEADMKLWAWALTKAIERNRQRHATRLPVRSGVAGILDRYPKFFVWHLGNGCFAYRLDCDGNQYILMSSSHDAQIPEIGAQNVALGRYAENGELIHESADEPIDCAEAWIEKELDSARAPENIADYFAMRLGAPLDDWSFRQLQKDTHAGEACRDVIDATASLMSHIQRIGGTNRAEMRKSVASMAQQIVSGYWRD